MDLNSLFVMGSGYGILMHHIENTERTSVVIVVVILILKKITVTTAVQEWTVIQNENFRSYLDRDGVLLPFMR